VSLLGVIKFIGAPGSLGFLLACGGVALLLRRLRRGRAIAALWLIVVCGTYLVLALPSVALAIAGRLPAARSDAPSAHDIDVVVVLDGDNRRGRLREGLRLWTECAPRRLVVSGGDWLVTHFREAGVPPDRLEQDASAATTREQIDWLARLASQVPPERMVLVASRLQMPRVERLVQSRRLHVKLQTSPIDTEPATAGWMMWIPSYSALRISRDALYELAALEYYERRGWIAG
jgi:uncharacterized SAM-binding protein YcdF (DUF218 family)